MTDPNTTTPATLRADALELLREIAARKRYDPNAKVPWANNSGSITINLKSELLARVDALLAAAPAAPVAAAESPSLANACEVLRDAVAAKSMLAIGMVHGLASFAKGDGAPSALVAAGVAQAPCKGKNCGATDGVSHSPECLAEYEAAVTGAVAADGAPSDDLLQLDVLLANLHAAVWHAGAGDDGPVDYDMAGKDEAKAIQRHVRAMLAERAAVSPATASLPIKIPHIHIRPEDEEIGRQYYALGFVDGSRSITDAPATAEKVYYGGSVEAGPVAFDEPATGAHVSLHDDLEHTKAVMEGRAPLTLTINPSAAPLTMTLPATANERAANPIKTTERDHSFIDNDLDFEPDAQHAVADMANIGYALMQTIERMAPGYCWNESPTEIVSDLINERDEARASQAAAPAEAREPHADDVAVDEFAIEMKAKMAAARAKGRSGWETCAPADLSRMLREHVEKGDPRDVANFCMMLHHHGAHISASAEARLPSAWVTPENDRAITQSQKQGMLRDGGASASSVRPYSIACYAGSAPAAEGAQGGKGGDRG
ncbi:hypothetical protein [Burkholderia gladioli]|uniref:hypothetical protein n=1 Tax=Burkholderia gladioli TaxID=28095 RepID=UPI00190664B3|nr:hypothetical protein [Burkholderia gladioli]MBJ9659830.1 hypothetical protein [Burkholderia gladioli]